MAITDDRRVKEFERQLNSKVKTEIDYVTGGKCSTLEDYKRRCGLITAYTESMTTLREILKRSVDDEDD